MPSTSSKNVSARQVDKFRRMARFVIEHHFGSRPSRMNYKSGGLSNFVFETVHSEGTFIVRISPDKANLNAFVKEQWCERIARQHGVPTAQILETGYSIIPFPYVIARSVEGISGADHPEREKIISELGRLGARINSIRTRGFGETFDWSNNELSRNSTFKDYFEVEYKYESRIETLKRHRICPPEMLKSIRRLASEMARLRARPVLNHGDLRLKNVIADPTGKITALIDWEKATSNIAPQWELSVALHDLGVDEKEKFVEGYGIGPKRLENLAPYMKVFNLLNYTDEINRVAGAKDKKGLTRIRTRVSGVFDLYSI